MTELTPIRRGRCAGAGNWQTQYQALQMTAREAAEELAVAARCEVVQVIGSKFVLFRYQHNKDKRKIELEKDRKRSV